MKILNEQLKEKVAIKMTNMFIHQAEIGTRNCPNLFAYEPKVSIELLKSAIEKEK